MRIPKRVKELGTIIIFGYMVVGSIIQFINTDDKMYLLLPAIFLGVLIWEVITRFFGLDQRNK